MLSEVLSSIEGVHIFPVVGLIIFVLAFIAITIWVMRLDKRTIIEAERLPLESGAVSEEDR